MSRIWYAISPIFWTVLIIILFVGALIGSIVMQYALVAVCSVIVLYLLITVAIGYVGDRLKQYDTNKRTEALRDERHIGFRK